MTDRNSYTVILILYGYIMTRITKDDVINGTEQPVFINVRLLRDAFAAHLILSRYSKGSSKDVVTYSDLVPNTHI